MEGLAGTTGDDMDDTSSTGDVIAAELREGYEAFCKISENRHTFARLRYVKDDGLGKSRLCQAKL